MKLNFILCTLLLMISCNNSDKNATKTETAEDTVSASAETQEEKFILEDLLKFNSEAELIDAYGEAVVKRSRGYYPEGMGQYPNTILYPETNNDVEFVWKDTLNFMILDNIVVEGEQTKWHMQNGITIGTTLKELELLNKKPFTFYGFEWDYSGAVAWDGGALEKTRLMVYLEYPGDDIYPKYDELIGDHPIKSDLPLAREANPVVRKIVLFKE